MPFALVLIVLAAAWRIVALHFFPALGNFSPLMALAFCGAVYFREKRLWLVPFIALTLSDLYLDYYYATVMNYHWAIGETAIRLLCFVAALGLGLMVSRHRSWLNLFFGAVAGSLIFYVVTNTAAWAADPQYTHDAGGWWQALTTGHPEFPPTWLFLRNTLLSDLFFTGLFAFAMEYAARRAGRPSLLARRVEA